MVVPTSNKKKELVPRRIEFVKSAGSGSSGSGKVILFSHYNFVV